MNRRSFLGGALALTLIPSISFLERIGVINKKPYIAIIPYIRKVHPTIISEQILGVQPMMGPVGEVFNLRYEYNGELDNWGNYII